jgi:DNA (cytosine-5)-methyltransferase 1
MKKRVKNRQVGKMSVVDFFCGAGGFSEGFRQQGFTIIKGIDFWQPAIDSHNLNHNLSDSTKNILEFWNENSANVDEINNVPNSEFIIGSPSCVSFSMSNRAGKADKSSGIKLIEAYLRVIAVKKYQKKSTLKAWYMENVPKSKDFIKDKYTFEDLNLSKWAKTNNKKPKNIALEAHGGIFNAGDYGAPQERKRFIAGEWVKTGEFIFPKKTHENHIKSCDTKNKMPQPNIKKSTKEWTDPNYLNLKLKTEEITDHFYDTGLYEIEWEKAEYLKVNHPFMGKMSFPENDNRTCRTITATKSASTRESIIYKSEYNRIGNGQYRLPTIREIASLMGFPCVYQFVGSEGVKWRQVGNSVCPHMSSALAKALRKKMNFSEIKLQDIDFSLLVNNHKKINNLNTFEEKKFNNPKKRKTNARFRRHPLKMGNMTVDLMNYHPDDKEKIAGWHLSTFFGTGIGHGIKVLEISDIHKIEKILENNFPHFSSFREEMQNHIATKQRLQKIYEEDLLLQEKDNPLKIIKRLARIITSYDSHEKNIEIDGIFPKDNIPMAQLMAMYGLLKLIQYNSLTQKV